MSILSRDPFADGSLVLGDGGISTRTIDGSNNNLGQPELGATSTPFIRLAPAEFEDGLSSPAGLASDAEGKQFIDADGNLITRQPIPIFTETEKNRLKSLGFEVVDNTEKLSNVPDAPFIWLEPSDRPSARVISNTLSSLEEGESLPNPDGLSALNWAFGQFVNHDNNLARVSEVNFPIDIPKDDPNFPLEIPPLPTISRQADNGLQFEFPRDSIADGTGVVLDDGTVIPAEAPNDLTHWLDLSAVYGSNDEFATAVRAFKAGKLKVFSEETWAVNDDLLPADEQNITRGGFFQGVGFLAGDDRVSEQDGLVSQHTLWVRNHNRLAVELSRYHSDWTDEQIFERARQINIAQYQKVVMYEWLPLQIGNVIDAYTGYDSTVSPQVSDEFNAAGLRLGHSQTGNKIESIDADGNVTVLPLLTTFGAPNINTGSDVDGILRGNTYTLEEEVDTEVVFDLRNALFPPAGVGFDLYSANMQRGRDRGLADYNQVRASFGLERVTSFNQITSDPELANSLETLYKSVEDIDLLVGLFAEDRVSPSGAGETIQAILADQFERSRASDRFWYERPISEGGFFTPEEIAEIEQTTFGDIIKLNSEIAHLVDDVFFTPSENNNIDDGLLDLTGFTGQAQVTISREAAFNNSVGFYVVTDREGTITDSVTGETWTPEQGADYARVAIANSIANFQVEDNLSSANFNFDLPVGSFLAPYLIQNGDIDDFENGRTEAFFAFDEANSDGIHHVLELGNGSNNTFKFAFEDLNSFGSGGSDKSIGHPYSDRDFNDMVMQVTLT